jgi:hypothetical protein
MCNSVCAIDIFENKLDVKYLHPYLRLVSKAHLKVYRHR